MIHIIPTGFGSMFEISGISYGYATGNDSLRGICYSIRSKWEKIIDAKFNTIIFNGNVNNEREGYTGDLYRSIKKHKLGNVIQTEKKHNPNSGNKIRVYLWTVDKKALSKWFKRHKHKVEFDNR